MILKVIEEIVELVLLIASIYLIIKIYAYHYQPAWSGPLIKRRLVTVLLLVLAVTAIKISGDVLDGESGLIDKTILLALHTYISSSFIGFFEMVTLSGSARVLIPLTAIITIALLGVRRRFEALLVATSVISAAIAIYLVKTMTSRIRPALWDVEWYWGSSFPSGHTLAVAALATALVACVARIRPALRNISTIVAILWMFLVALSRLVLGVHWPTDVLVAMCIGASLPLVISVVYGIHEVE